MPGSQSDPRTSYPERRPDGAEPTRPPARNWALTFAAVVLGMLVYVLRYELLPFIIAGVIAFVLDPVIRWLRPRMGGKRWVPATVLFLVLLVIAAGAVYWVGGVVLADGENLIRNGPRMLHELVVKVVGQGQVSVFGRTYTADTLTHTLEGQIPVRRRSQHIYTVYRHRPGRHPGHIPRLWC